MPDISKRDTWTTVINGLGGAVPLFIIAAGTADSFLAVVENMWSIPTGQIIVCVPFDVQTQWGLAIVAACTAKGITVYPGLPSALSAMSLPSNKTMLLEVSQITDSITYFEDLVDFAELPSSFVLYIGENLTVEQADYWTGIVESNGPNHFLALAVGDHVNFDYVIEELTGLGTLHLSLLNAINQAVLNLG